MMIICKVAFPNFPKSKYSDACPARFWQGLAAAQVSMSSPKPCVGNKGVMDSGFLKLESYG